jgi:hypothetical protein
MVWTHRKGVQSMVTDRQMRRLMSLLQDGQGGEVRIAQELLPQGGIEARMKYVGPLERLENTGFPRIARIALPKYLKNRVAPPENVGYTLVRCMCV